MATEIEKKMEAKKRELVSRWNADPANAGRPYREFAEWITPLLHEHKGAIVQNVGFNPRS